MVNRYLIHYTYEEFIWPERDLTDKPAELEMNNDLSEHWTVFER